MRTVLPGTPQAQLQAVSTAQWKGRRLVAYVSGNGIVILGGPQDLIQTIYLDHCDDLTSIAIDNQSGKIAVCSTDEIFVYKPYGREEGILKWSLNLTLEIAEDCDDVTALSWGSQEELLTSNEALRLYRAGEDGRQIWSQRLPKPVKIAKFSPDASFIASVGWHDRLVKLWRRQSFDSDDTRFEFSYLVHPASVTLIHWRRAHKSEHHHPEEHIDDVLFSVCTDNKIRIWAATDPHGVSYMQQWAQIDMQECLQPRGLEVTSDASERFVIFLDKDDFVQAAQASLQSKASPSSRQDHALDHLAEIVQTEPDVCIVLDHHGHLSAWGLESIGCKIRKDADIFNITHIQDANVLATHVQARPGVDNVQLLAFVSETSSQITFIFHYFDGQISWQEGKADELFDPSPQQHRLKSKALWTGHASPIIKTVRDVSGQALLSCAENGDFLVWKRHTDVENPLLLRQSTFHWDSPVRHGCLLAEGDLTVTLHTSELCLWDTHAYPARLISRQPLKPSENFTQILSLPEPKSGSLNNFFAAVTPQLSGQVWKCSPMQTTSDDDVKGTTTKYRMDKFCDFQTDTTEKLDSVIAIDPSGSSPVSTSSLDAFAKAFALASSKSGTLSTWAANVDLEQSNVCFRMMAKVETQIVGPSLISGGPNSRTCLVDSSRLRLTIWDMQSAQLEYDKCFGDLDIVQDLDWSSTPDSQSLLAVGFPFKVTIIAQMRFNYAIETPAWAPIQEISTKDLTSHPIGDSAWLSNGNLVIGAGNQLYVCSEDVSAADNTIDDLGLTVHEAKNASMFDLVSYLNGPLPVYNPQFLSQCVLAGCSTLASDVGLALFNTLKYFSPGDDLPTYLSLPIESFSEKVFVGRVSGPSEDGRRDDEVEELTENVTLAINETLSKTALPHLSSPEQLMLGNAMECLSLISRQSQALDDNSKRYYYFFNQHMLQKARKNVERESLSWREYVWASRSNCQDIIVDIVSKCYRSGMLWEHARESGMFIWLTDTNALQAHMEVIARNEYTKTDEKNPVDCSLYYLALRKKSVLLGLWRMATWNREQAGTQRLLKNNFEEAKWKTVASKNAYALLGKRRFEYAAAWFLLAGSLQDAVSICVHQMNDLQLAIAIARVYEGNESPVLHALLKDKVLPQAAAHGNRWQASWAFTMLNNHSMAIRALTEPLATLIPTPQTPRLESRSYLTHDPALLILYQQLRSTFPRTKTKTKDNKQQQQQQQQDQDPFPITPLVEWTWVLQTARTYDRMGCDLLALRLVRNWEFLPEGMMAPNVDKEVTAEDTVTEKEGEEKKERRKSTASAAGRRRSTKGSSSDGGMVSPREEKAKAKAKPTTFEEPDANSLLDSFGF